MGQKKNHFEGLVYSTNPDYIKPEEVVEQETLANDKQLLKVKIDTKQRGGKVVTIIEGFIGNSEDLETLGKLLKNKCGTGGSIKENCILIQGDQKTKIILLLQSLNYKVKA